MYSPLEQFEPIPLLTLFFGGINFSITNVTIIFIYIVLIILYFLNGYIIDTNKRKIANFVHPKGGTLKVRTISPLSLNSFYNSISAAGFGGSSLNFFSIKLVSYLTYLENAYNSGVLSKGIKEGWLGLNSLSLPNLKSEYSREFHKVFFNCLKTKKTEFSSDFVFFNNIQLYFSNFLNNLFFKANLLNLNTIKRELSVSNTLYYFSTQTNFSKKLVSNFNIYILEMLYNVILNMVKENIGGSVKKVIRFFPFIFTLFVFILSANLIGLIPYSSTVTSYLIVTFAMAIMVLVGVNIIAGRFHGLVYFGHFLPAGCPFALYPLIIPIEFISYVFRVVSLSVRLFANMMAGHTLLAVLAGFGWTMANASVSLLFLHPLPILVVFVLVFLETAVAIIQAYVFTILTCMYLDEAINLH